MGQNRKRKHRIQHTATWLNQTRTALCTRKCLPWLKQTLWIVDLPIKPSWISQMTGWTHSPYLLLHILISPWIKWEGYRKLSMILSVARFQTQLSFLKANSSSNLVPQKISSKGTVVTAALPIRWCPECLEYFQMQYLFHPLNKFQDNLQRSQVRIPSKPRKCFFFPSLFFVSLFVFFRCCFLFVCLLFLGYFAIA